MLRQVLLQMSKSTRVRQLVESAPVSRDVVRRFVAGEATADAIRTAAEITDSNRLVSLDHLGEDTTDIAQARAIRDAYTTLLRGLAAEGLTGGGRSEVSMKLSAVGQALPGDGEKIALEHAWDVCQAASEAGTTVTLDMEDHTTTDSTLSVLRELRGDFPWVGAVLQSYLRRTESDCISNIPRSRFKLVWRGLENNLLKGHVFDHIAAALPRRHFVEQFRFAIHHANACWAKNFMSRKDKEIRIQRLHIDA